MRVLFTSSDKWFSKTIRNLTLEDVSHTAIEFPEAGVVVHSDLLGLRIVSSRTFRKINHIKYEVDILSSVDFKDGKVQDLLEAHEGALYDYGAFMFLGLSLAARKYLKAPLPKSNLWESSGMFLCVGWDTKLIFEKEDDMITPYKLYLKLKGLRDQGLLA